MRDEAEGADQQFPKWNGFVSDIDEFMPANEGAVIARPQAGFQPKRNITDAEIFMEPDWIGLRIIVRAHARRLSNKTPSGLDAEGVPG